MATEREPYAIGSAEYAERLRIEKSRGQAFGLGDLTFQRLRDYPVREWGNAEEFADLPEPDRYKRCRFCDLPFEIVGGGQGSRTRAFCSDECRAMRTAETTSRANRKRWTSGAIQEWRRNRGLK